MKLCTLIYVSTAAIALITICSANENSVFLYNPIESCKSTEYYDVNYFACRECDPRLSLIPSENGKKLHRYLKAYL